MKNIIFLLTTIMLVCLPKSAMSDPASINGNISVWHLDPVPLLSIIAGGSPLYSMDNFEANKDYKIQLEYETPDLAQNISMTVGNVFIDSDSSFTYSTSAEFAIQYFISPNTLVGQTQLLKFKIYKKTLGFWDWQTTFYYYVNTTCPTSATLSQGPYPLFQGDYEVTNNLTVSSSVDPHNVLAEFDAGSSVTLLPGFISMLSGTGAISIINDGCGGAYRSSNITSSDPKGEVVLAINYKNANILLYPNPTNDLISISIPNAISGEKIKVETRDINGRLVYSEDKLYDPSISVDLKLLKPGLYFITISGTNLNYNQKIVRQ